MGGNIFQTSAANALSTPRMPKPVYDHMSLKVHAILDALRGPDRVEAHKTPLPAPEKDKFGDIDVIVLKTVAAEDIKNGKPDFTPFLVKLQDAFGAVRKTRTHGSHASYAIPWPAQYLVPELSNAEQEKLPDILKGFSLEPKHHFVQVDVNVVHSRTVFDYKYMHESHSNAFICLSASLSRVGLTAGDEGLRLRVQEMKDAGQTKSNNTVDLTSNAKDVCDIVGWDYDRFLSPKGFSSKWDLFEFIASSKYFLPPQEKSEDGQVVEAPLNAKERRKLDLPVYGGWVKQFLPTTINNPAYKRDVPDYTKVREEMFQRFPHARAAYKELLDKFRAKNRDDRVRKAIKDTLPAAEKLNLDDPLRKYAAAGLKQLLVGETTGFDDVEKSKATKYPLPDLPILDSADLNVEALSRWICEHWQEVGLWKMWVAPGEALPTNGNRHGNVNANGYAA